MTTRELLKLIKKKINEERDEIALNLLNGRAASHEEYKRMTGVAQGLAMADDIITGSLKDDDEE